MNAAKGARTLLSATVLALLCSCGPFIDTKHGIVSGGFMSTTQGFSGKMKALDGSSAVWSITGTDSTSVPNNAMGMISTVSAGNNLLKGQQSNNLTDVKKAGIASKTQLGSQKLTNDAAATAGKQDIAKTLIQNGKPVKPPGT